MAAIELAVVRVWPKSSIASCTAAVGHGYRRNQAFLILGRARPLPLQHKCQGHQGQGKGCGPWPMPAAPDHGDHNRASSCPEVGREKELTAHPPTSVRINAIDAGLVGHETALSPNSTAINPKQIMLRGQGPWPMLLDLKLMV